MNDRMTEILCFVDDFIKEYEKSVTSIGNRKRKRGPEGRLCNSEILTIILSYYSSNYDCFKNYYIEKIMKDHVTDFHLVNYSHFTSLIKRVTNLGAVLLGNLFAKCDGLSFVDSTSIEVCKNYRIYIHKVFEGLAARGKTTKGWFYGFKLHLIINSKGELLKVKFTAGNRDDRAAIKSMTKNIHGKVFADRGYISRTLFKSLHHQGIQLVTRLRKNMNNILMTSYDKAMLLKRCLIETVIGRIKLLNKFEHSRHRSTPNAFTHMLASLINYQLLENKPSIHNLLQIV